MKTGLVLEGGAMRGLFSAGVIDIFMENKIAFDGAIGVSAGAAFGCNYKSNQPGRVIRYNKKYCNDPRYAGVSSFVKTGEIFGTDFCYNEIPNVLDPFDVETYQASPMEFVAVCTDVETGKAVYHKCEKGTDEDIMWFRASASMPIAAKKVEIDGKLLLDGGVADSIPIKHWLKSGYDKNVVILTQPRGYVKTKNSMMPLIKAAYRKYPKFVKAMETRHIRYNETLEFIDQQEALGNIFVIRPPKALGIGHIEHEPAKLEEVYQIGRREALVRLGAVRRYLEA